MVPATKAMRSFLGNEMVRRLGLLTFEPRTLLWSVGTLLCLFLAGYNVCSIIHPL